jgi:hypothetical protein
MQAFEESTRVKRLDAVMNKALDVSGLAFTEQDLSECFGSIKTQFGPSMSRLFSNMLVKLRSNMESGYRDICIRHDLDEKLLTLENVKYADTGSVSVTETVNQSTEQLKRMEAEQLRAALKLIAASTASLQERATKLRQQMASELAHAAEERQKLQG